MSKSSLQLIDDLILEIEHSLADPVVPVASKIDEPAAFPEVAPPKPVLLVDGQEVTVNSLDLRVGKIVRVHRHETADKLYCEEIDVGEEVPRPIASGLVPHYSLEQMQDRVCIVVCNLKPRKLVGFKSNGMVLCAAKKRPNGTEHVEFVDLPGNAQIGDRIVGLNLSGEPVSAKQCDKYNVFEAVAADLSVDGEGVACWRGVPLVVQRIGEPCTAPTLRDAILR